MNKRVQKKGVADGRSERWAVGERFSFGFMIYELKKNKRSVTHENRPKWRRKKIDGGVVWLYIFLLNFNVDLMKIIYSLRK
jgi:hypothetical protein